MRVVAGQYGSRKLAAVPGKGTRPTTDKVKESIFNLIGGFFSGGCCLDFYAGSGAIAIEAVSRGMDRAVLCEKSSLAITTIQENIIMTKETEKFTLLKGDNRRSLENYAHERTGLVFDLVFLDPPYAKEQIVEDIQWLNGKDLLNQDAIIICETDPDHKLPETIENFKKEKYKQYGLSCVHVYYRKAGKLNE